MLRGLQQQSPIPCHSTIGTGSPGPIRGQYSQCGPIKGQYPRCGPIIGQYSRCGPIRSQYSLNAFCPCVTGANPLPLCVPILVLFAFCQPQKLPQLYIVDLTPVGYMFFIFQIPMCYIQSCFVYYVSDGGRCGGLLSNPNFPFPNLLLSIFVKISIHETQNLIVSPLKIDCKVMKQTVWVCQVLFKKVIIFV